MNTELEKTTTDLAARAAGIQVVDQASATVATELILAEPPSCPNDCPFADNCDSDNAGVCELNESCGVPLGPDERDEADEADER